jgi:hypothetical protein
VLSLPATNGANDYNSEVNGGYWLRLPIHNKAGRDAAQNVEVFLESVLALGPASAPVNAIPMRIGWCHGAQANCASIPGGGFRLLNLGVIQTGTLQREGASFNVDLPRFIIGGETYAEAHAPLAIGSFEIGITLSATGVPPERRALRVKIRDPQDGTSPPGTVTIL